MCVAAAASAVVVCTLVVCVCLCLVLGRVQVSCQVELEEQKAWIHKADAVFAVKAAVAIQRQKQLPCY